MKPNGLVFAASMTSHTSMPIRWHISAISLTSPMLTARNVFSSSFTISATCVEVTGTTVSTPLPIQRRGHLGAGRRRCRRRPSACSACVNFAFAGIDALGREREEEVLRPTFSPLRLEHRLQHFRRSCPDRSSTRGRSACPGGGTWRSLGRRDDVGHVGILRLPQRRRHADVDASMSASRDMSVVARSRPAFDAARRRPRSDVADVAAAGVDLARPSLRRRRIR